MKDTKRNFTLRLEKDLHKTLKIFCLERNVTMLEYVQELIEKDLYKGDENYVQR